MGVLILAGVMDDGQNPPPRFVGLFFIIIALIIMAGAVAMAVCNLMVAKSLREHTRYTFCIVVAALNLMFSPLGMIIGIFSLIVLLRDSVKQLFTRGVPPMSVEMPNWR
jgi:ABC-type Na+ efflux pump permease subunit